MAQEPHEGSVNGATVKACLAQKRKQAVKECITGFTLHRLVLVVQCQSVLILLAKTAQVMLWGPSHTCFLQFRMTIGLPAARKIENTYSVP